MTGRGTSVNARACPRRVARRAICAIAGVAIGAPSVNAQGALTRTDEAATVPRGFVRVRAIPSWSRFDMRFTGSSADGPSTVPLASALAAESLGVAQIPGLASAEQALRTLSGDPSFRLSLGRSVAVASARVVTTALVAEYGLTRRITVAALVPVVQSRSELFVTLNAGDDDAANVGPNPGRITAAGRAPAVALQDQLGQARATLQARLAGCEQNPASDPSCPTILANRDDVESLIAQTGAFTSALAVLFGTSTSAVTQPFAALTGTAAGSAIAAQLAALKERFRIYVGAAADEIVATVPLAVGPAGFGDIQRLLLAGEFGLSPDSLGQTYRLNFGDIELGAKVLAFETAGWALPPSGAGPWLRARLALTGVVRLGTGSPTLERIPYRYLEQGTGDGQTDLEGGALLDVGVGRRLVVTAAARYTAQLGQAGAGRVPDEDGVVHPFTPLHGGTRRLGDVLVAEVTPRYLVGRWFAADAHYALVVRGDDEYSAVDDGAPLLRGGFTEQRVGVGITYSTLRGARTLLPRVPIELSIARIETISGSNGLVPRAARNQIEARLYYRVLR